MNAEVAKSKTDGTLLALGATWAMKFVAQIRTPMPESTGALKSLDMADRAFVLEPIQART